MFTFDPADYAEQFASQDYVYIPKGLTESYYDLICRQVDKHLQADRLANFNVGDKQQALYQFPDDGAYLAEFNRVVSAVCGLDAEKCVIAERHIKVYDATANPKPLVHKDRFATAVSVGFGVRVAPGSKLVLYPYDDRDENPFSSSTEMRDSLDGDRLPEKTLKNAKRVEFSDGPRDVIMFRGSSMWHMREYGANTVMLYFKMNTFNADPLGEDPRTPEFRQRTQQLAALSDDELLHVTPVLGRRVDHVHRRYNHLWQETLGVVLWGEKHFTIDEFELRFLQALDGRRTIADVLACANGHTDHAECLQKVRRLVKRGVLDLLPATATCNTVTPCCHHDELVMA